MHWLSPGYGFKAIIPKPINSPHFVQFVSLPKYSLVYAPEAPMFHIYPNPPAPTP